MENVGKKVMKTSEDFYEVGDIITDGKLIEHQKRFLQ